MCWLHPLTCKYRHVLQFFLIKVCLYIYYVSLARVCQHKSLSGAYGCGTVHAEALARHKVLAPYVWPQVVLGNAAAGPCAATWTAALTHMNGRLWHAPGCGRSTGLAARYADGQAGAGEQKGHRLTTERACVV